MEANAALRTIVRRDNGEGYRAMLTRMAKESGIETPTAEDLIRLDRNRKGKKLSNAEWQSPTDPRLIPREDEEISSAVQQILESEGVRVSAGARDMRVAAAAG